MPRLAPDRRQQGVLYLLEKENIVKKNAQLARLVDKLNKATRLLAETASALTVEVESRHHVIDMLSSMPAAGRAQAAPKASAKAKAKVKPKTKVKAKKLASKPRDPNAPRRGRPAGTGRFETRSDLEAFVRGRRRAGDPLSVIADGAGVSTAVVVRILQNSKGAAHVDSFSTVASPSGMTVEAAA